MAVEQHAELVDAVGDLGLAEDVMLFLNAAGLSEDFVQRQHGVVRRVIGVMAGRAIGRRTRDVAHGVVVGNRDRLVVRHEEAVLRAGRRAPAAHARVGARLVEIDGGLAALGVRAGVLRHPLLVGAPAEFGRLHAFREKALDRPRVDEDLHRLRLLGALRVALGDVDALHADLLHQLRPFFPRLRARGAEAEIGCDVEQRLLDEPGDHAGVRAAGGDGGRAAGRTALLGEQRLAQRVVRARVGAERLIEIEAGPRLDHRVDVKNAELAAEPHDVDRGRVDRQVDAEALAFALRQQRREQVAVIVGGDRLLQERVAAFVDEGAVGVVRVDDGETRMVEVEMALDEWQRAAADRSEADHDDGTGDGAVLLPVSHSSLHAALASDAPAVSRGS